MNLYIVNIEYKKHGVILVCVRRKSFARVHLAIDPGAINLIKMSDLLLYSLLHEGGCVGYFFTYKFFTIVFVI